MKRRLLLLLFLFITVSNFSFAKDSSSSTDPKYALGLTTDSHILYYGTPGFTGQYFLDAKNLLQGYFIWTSVSSFNFGMGASYKYIIKGDRKLGLHIGGGLGLGLYASAKIFMRFAPLGGIHFQALENLHVHLDAGPTFSLEDWTAGYAMTAHSSLLGLSILYAF